MEKAINPMILLSVLRIDVKLLQYNCIDKYMNEFTLILCNCGATKTLLLNNPQTRDDTGKEGAVTELDPIKNGRF
jgi:hypothetical protein